MAQTEGIPRLTPKQRTALMTELDRGKPPALALDIVGIEHTKYLALVEDGIRRPRGVNGALARDCKRKFALKVSAVEDSILDPQQAAGAMVRWAWLKAMRPDIYAQSRKALAPAELAARASAIQNEMLDNAT